MRGFGLKFKKGDLSAALFVIALIIVIVLSGRTGEGGGVAAVTLDGEVIARLPLDTDAVFEADGKYHAVIEVKDGQVFVRESDCPNGDCVKSGKISRKGQSIVCLPGRLTVTVEGDGLDAVIG